jgi:cell division protein FtsI/penicillin-binding protein 2
VPRGYGSRHRRPPQRRPLLAALAKNKRLTATIVVAAVVLGVGFANGFGGQGSAEPTVQAFLLDWQQGNYAQAAALTDGTAPDVTAQLAAAYTDLDASSQYFTMQGITQHGSTAVATYVATVDLAQAGQQWSYVGKLGLTAQHGHWTVDWAPSVINPSLGAGDRLAVETTYAPRASILDTADQPLNAESTDYRIGVYPGRLKNAAATAAGFSQVTALDEGQVLGQIQAAPPASFLSLLTLSPAKFSSLWPKLSRVPGLSYQRQSDRLFSSSAQGVVGAVGTEDSRTLRREGMAYQPGMTVGLTGLERAFQNSLVGTPTTTVDVVNAAGRVTKQWILKGGHAGTPVRTTLNGQDQAAAVSALAGQPNSAELVAVDSASGAIRALATRSAGGVPLPLGGPLDAKVVPGMTFSIVSAAAILATGIDANHPLPCETVADVGGVTFTYQPVTAATSTFAQDFANGCGTAFANMSRTLTPRQLTSAERAFGIGSSWGLRLPAFSGLASAASGEADVASQMTGTGGVLMSPLGMATVAAEVASGTGHSPVIVPTDVSRTWQPPLSGTSLAELRQLMRLAVTSGSAQAANVPGTPVYGQAGVVQSGRHAYLSWFVGYRGTLAVAVLETGTTPSQTAAALAGTFLRTAH